MKNDEELKVEEDSSCGRAGRKAYSTPSVNLLGNVKELTGQFDSVILP